MEEREIEDGSKIKQQEFFGVITNVMRTAMVLKTPLKQWLTVHNLFLLKEAGNHKVSGFRKIHKVDAELNLLRRVHIAHWTMNGAEQHAFIHKDLYSGRKGITAVDPVLITTLSREIFHLQRSNAGTTDCDVAACYDGLIIGPTAIAETNAGTPED
eukprot:2331400-Ditylum_brightwellii.AAC.1